MSGLRTPSPDKPAARTRPRGRIWSVTSAITLLFLVALCGTFFEDFKDSFPWLTELQLRSYNAVTHLEARKPRPKFVIGIEVDDATFYDTMHLGHGDITNRCYLAQMIRTVAAFHPAVIAIDIDLRKEAPDDYDETRKTANQALLSAIREAEANSIPIILTVRITDGKVQESIFEDRALPGINDPKNAYRVRAGFDNAAEELRKVPLTVDAQSPDGGVHPYNSFALAAAEAYEDSLGIRPATSSRLNQQIADRRFVYTSFLRQDEFPSVSANSVLRHDVDQLRMLNHRIVLIGGNRHTSRGESAFLDDHYLPPFHMRGMYFQANYIEGLLDDRIRTTVPRLVAFVIDLSLGTLIIYFSHKGKSTRARLLLLAVFVVPLLFAYVAAINLGYVLDFVLPVLLLFLHVFVDHYIHLRRLASHKEHE